jgi:reverse gyrase
LCSAARPPDQRIAPADYVDPMSPMEEQLMSTSESSSTSAQEQYLDAVRESQEAWANVVRAWSDSVQRMWGDPASTTTREAPTAEQVIDNLFGFAEELLAAQRDFAKRLVQASAPAVDAAKSTGKSTTKKATS